MLNAVIIGGGLTGLAAAYELEQQRIPYTLIEVKHRLGGSIASQRQDGFILDAGPMAIPGTGNWPLLTELGLDDAVYPLVEQPGGDYFAFKQGAQALVDALARRLTGTMLLKTGVSSIGEVEGQYAVCLENGLMLTASALIVAAPARYAERMFRSFAPEISERLWNYRYDTITRVSLGYRCDQIKLPLDLPWDVAMAHSLWTDYPSRVPDDHLLIQLGVRIPPDRATPEALVSTLQQQLGWPTNPAAVLVARWPEADPLSCLMPGHRENMDAIERLLPQGVALAGSDYRAQRFQDRVEQGQEAARRIGAWLREK